jgi:hypothetical protein
VNNKSAKRPKATFSPIHNVIASTDSQTMAIGNVVNGHRPYTGQLVGSRILPAVKMSREFANVVEELPPISPTSSLYKQKSPISIYHLPNVVISSPQPQPNATSMKITSLRFKNDKKRPENSNY